LHLNDLSFSSSPEMIFGKDWFLNLILVQWEKWCEGIKEPSDKLLQTLRDFDWVALLDASVHYVLTTVSMLWSRLDKFGGRDEIFLGIETIMKWLEVQFQLFLLLI
jgi:hypothetical protein